MLALLWDIATVVVCLAVADPLFREVDRGIRNP